MRELAAVVLTVAFGGVLISAVMLFGPSGFIALPASLFIGAIVGQAVTS